MDQMPFPEKLEDLFKRYSFKGDKDSYIRADLIPIFRDKRLIGIYAIDNEGDESK